MVQFLTWFVWPQLHNGMLYTAIAQVQIICWTHSSFAECLLTHDSLSCMFDPLRSVVMIWDIPVAIAVESYLAYPTDIISKQTIHLLYIQWNTTFDIRGGLCVQWAYKYIIVYIIHDIRCNMNVQMMHIGPIMLIGEPKINGFDHQ